MLRDVGFCADQTVIRTCRNIPLRTCREIVKIAARFFNIADDRRVKLLRECERNPRNQCIIQRVIIAHKFH